MSPILLIGVTVVYLIVAADRLIAANYGLSVFLFGCAVANVGVAMMAKG